MTIKTLIRRNISILALIALAAAVILLVPAGTAAASDGCLQIKPGQVIYDSVWTDAPACFMLTGTTEGGRVVLETERWGPGNEFAMHDTVLSVYKVSGNPDASGGVQFTRVAYNDDIDWPVNPYSRVAFTSDGGTYMVNVEGFNGGTGFFKLVVSQSVTATAVDLCDYFCSVPLFD